jgi:hypothetical protein
VPLERVFICVHLWLQIEGPSHAASARRASAVAVVVGVARMSTSPPARIGLQQTIVTPQFCPQASSSSNRMTMRASVSPVVKAHVADAQLEFPEKMRAMVESNTHRGNGARDKTGRPRARARAIGRRPAETLEKVLGARLWLPAKEVH